MPFDNPRSGLSGASEFQSSALPWVTSSQAPIVGALGTALKIEFPKVTRFITITNLDSAANKLRLAFTENGLKSTSGNHYLIPGQQTLTLEVRVKTLFLAGDTTLTPLSLFAGLTTVDAGLMPQLSGTLFSGSVPNGFTGWSGVG